MTIVQVGALRGRDIARHGPPSDASPRQELFQPADVVVAVGDVRLGDEILEQRDRGPHAVDDELVERAAEPHQAFDAVAPVHDQLADQAVVVGRHRIALIDGGIDAHAEPARRVVIGDLAGRGRKGRRVLGVDAALDGVAWRT